MVTSILTTSHWLELSHGLTYLQRRLGNVVCIGREEKREDPSQSLAKVLWEIVALSPPYFL